MSLDPPVSALQKGLERYNPPGLLSFLATQLIGIAGVGGLGSNLAMILARSGLRRFILVDSDSVEASNLNRQCFFPEDLGRAKVAALAAQLHRLDPSLEIRTHILTLDARNAGGVFSGCTVLAEALDAPEAKAMLFETMASSALFYVGASGLAGVSRSDMPDMRIRKIGRKAVIVGDFVSDAATLPPLAPRVTQAAAMQADQILAYLFATYRGKID